MSGLTAEVVREMVEGTKQSNRQKAVKAVVALRDVAFDLAGLVLAQANELRLLQGDIYNTERDADYLEGLNAHDPDRSYAGDLRSLSAFGALVPFARGRARAAANELDRLAEALAGAAARERPLLAGEC